MLWWKILEFSSCKRMGWTYFSEECQSIFSLDFRSPIDHSQDDGSNECFLFELIIWLGGWSEFPDCSYSLLYWICTSWYSPESLQVDCYLPFYQISNKRNFQGTLEGKGKTNDRFPLHHHLVKENRKYFSVRCCTILKPFNYTNFKYAWV